MKNNSDLSINTVVNKLNSGGIVCFPTETVYALGCDPYNDTAIERLNKLKARKPNQPLSLLVKDLEQLCGLAEISSKAKLFIQKYSPGPITYIVKKKPNCHLSNLINPNANTIGVRIPDHAVSLEILNQFGKPIIGTSANLSGNKSATAINDLDPALVGNLDAIYDAGPSDIGVPSTIVNIVDIDNIEIIRQGTVKILQP